MWSCHTAADLLEAGLPALAVVCKEFETLARVAFKGRGVTDAPIVILPERLEARPEDEVRKIAKTKSDEIIARLTSGF